MGWTTPPTLAVGDGLSSAFMNTYLRDDLLDLYGDASFTAVALSSGWTNAGGSFAPAGYAKIGPYVHLRGLIQNGTVGSGNTVFTLPSTHRPSGDQIFTVVANQLIGRVDVLAATGTVTVIVGSNVWVSLDRIFFVWGSE